MLDPNMPVSIPGSDLLAYADLDAAEVLWVCPRAPRLTRAADGGADIQLLLYRRGASGPIEGGQFSLSIDFALTPAESAAALQAASLRRAAVTDTESEPPPARWQSFAWRSAALTVTLAPGIQLRGNGSLIGSNTATLAMSLDAATAPGIDHAWSSGFPDATATAEVEVDAMTSGSASTTLTTAAAMATGGAVSAALTAYQQATAATRLRVAHVLPLTLSGPLHLPTSTAPDRRTVITL